MPISVLLKKQKVHFWGEKPGEDFLVRSLEKPVRTLICQVLERSKPPLYFQSLLTTNQHTEVSFNRTHEWECMCFAKWQSLQKLRYDLKGYLQWVSLPEFAADKFIDSL